MAGLGLPGTVPGVSIIYGLDIETDTTVNGFDPSVARILSVAVATHDGAQRVVLDHDDEHTLLTELLAALGGLEPGIIVTWNGSGFDIAFLIARFAHHRMSHGWDTWPSSRASKYPPVGSHPLRARLGAHSHADVAFAYKEWCDEKGVEWSLKPVARALGRTPIEVDRAATHELSASVLRAYVASDAEETAFLAVRLGGSLASHVD